MNDALVGVFRECTNSECRFRYPDTRIEYTEDYCPKCGSPSVIKSRVVSTAEKKTKHITAQSAGLVVLLDNIRSMYNVGSIFRTCEGLGIKDIYLAGITPTPENDRLAKTGLGAEDMIRWSHHNNALVLVNELRDRGFFLLGLECTQSAINLDKFVLPMIGQPVCLIAGNERLGIDPEIQNKCDALVCIPMQGKKESLNVSVAFAITAFYLMDSLKKDGSTPV
ncbi:MAG: TrmH family RNA methyltransferase [Chloroflexi bacterium]|nr:TrmH family RNA methyltransferase [Chloroflexota bacterium]